MRKSDQLISHADDMSNKETSKSFGFASQERHGKSLVCISILLLGGA